MVHSYDLGRCEHSVGVCACVCYPIASCCIACCLLTSVLYTIGVIVIVMHVYIFADYNTVAVNTRETLPKILCIITGK